MSDLVPTAGQTIGPFFGYALPYECGQDLVPPGTPGAIRLHGHVYDGAGQPVPDALIELWQTDAEGKVVQREGSLQRDGWTFTGWGRAATDPAGRFSFTTVRPGTGFLSVTFFARGLLDRLFTRVYLPGTEPLDPTLLATEEDGVGESYRWDIHLQGDEETTFLDLPQSYARVR